MKIPYLVSITEEWKSEDGKAFVRELSILDGIFGCEYGRFSRGSKLIDIAIGPIRLSYSTFVPTSRLTLSVWLRKVWMKIGLNIELASWAN